MSTSAVEPRVWLPRPDGRYHTQDGKDHATWADLHARHDLVEVLETTPVRSPSSGCGRVVPLTTAADKSSEMASALADDREETTSWPSAA